MKFEKLKKQDTETVAKIIDKYWKERGFDYSMGYIKEYLKVGHRKEIIEDSFFVLKENDKVLGNISIIIVDDKLAELRDFVVKEEYRGKGYGKEIIKNVLDFCKKNNIRKVIAISFPEYLEFFKKFGFQQEGYLKDHFFDGEDMLFLSLILR